MLKTNPSTLPNMQLYFMLSVLFESIVKISKFGM